MFSFINIFFIVSFVALAACENCEVVECGDSITNTYQFCLQNNTEVHETCTGWGWHVKRKNFIDEEKKLLLAAHDDYRKKITFCSNLIKFVWDDDLQRLAERQVRKCPTNVEQYDNCQFMERFDSVVEQRIFYEELLGKDTDINFEQLVNSWTKEDDQFLRTDDCFSYNTFMGCSIVVTYRPSLTSGHGIGYIDLDHLPVKIVKHIVCNYATL